MEASNKRTASSPLPEDDVDEYGVKTRSHVKRINLEDLGENPHDPDMAENEESPPENARNQSQEEPATHDNLELSMPSASSSSKTGKISLDDKVDMLSDKVDKILGYLVTNKGELTAINKRNEKKFKILENAHNDVADKMTKISTDITSNAVQIARNSTNIEANEAAIASLDTQLRICKATNEEYIGKFKDMDTEMKCLRAELAENRRCVLDLGLEVRERRLFVAGVPEQNQEDPVAVALSASNKLLSYTLKKTKSETKGTGSRPKFRLLKINDIDDAYRIGKATKRNKTGRGLVVTFSFTHIRQMLLATKRFTKDMDTKYFVSEDLMQIAKDHRANLKVIAEAGQSLGHETKITGNKLLIDSEPFQPDELSAVSPTILQASKREKHLDDAIAFRGDRSIFSNFFPAPMIVDDTEYSCVEQYFQHEKATQCGYPNKARKIMNKPNPWYIIIVSNKVEINDEWKKVRIKVLYKGIFAKFDQNPPLKQALLNTVGLKLYEATTDLFYACGIDLDSPKWATNDWPGQNVTGQVLMKVRRELLEEDTLGNSTDNHTLMNLSSSLDEADIEEEGEGKCDMAKDPIPPMETEDGLQEWPSLEKSPTPAHVSKSSWPAKNRGQAPKLNKSLPQFTPKKGWGRQPQQRSTSKNDAFSSGTLSSDDMAFLEVTKNKKNTQQSHRLPGNQPNRNDRGRRRGKPSNATSTPKNSNMNWSSSADLSPKQRAAMKYIGLQPDSDFVRNIVSSRSEHK